MKIIKIKQEKQENGLWGIPICCYSIDRIIFKNELKFSALITAISEFYNYKNFEVINSTDDAFFINITGVKVNKFRIAYDKYEVVDNLLYEFANDNEKKIFLRKHKIKKLERINL